MTVLTILILLGVFYLVNIGLSFKQSKDFANTYVALRKQGKVVIGKFKRLLSSGAIVMFAIDENDVIIDAKVLSGITVFSRFKPLQLFAGIPVANLAAADTSKLPKNIRKSVENASLNYARFMAGAEVSDPAGPWKRIGNTFNPRKQKVG